MLLCTTEGDPEREEQYLTLLRAKQVDGALVDGLVLPPDRIAAFVQDGFPIVCLDRDVDSTSIPLVQVDNRLGATARHRAPDLARAPRGSPMSPARRSCASATSGSRATATRWRRGGIEAGPAARRGRATSPRRAGTRRRGAARVGSDASRAIFAANDLSAIGASARARRERPRVCPTTSRSSASTTFGSAQFTSPPLTTIRQPATEIAQRATQLLLDLIARQAGPRSSGICSSRRWSCAPRRRRRAPPST